jgi:hypothetical protein
VTGCDETTTQYTTGSSITDDEFDLLLTNGMGNFKDGDPINVMPASAQCGIDGKFIEEVDGENGWIEPTTGLYRKFEGGIGAADSTCSDLIGTTAVSDVTPSDYVGDGTGEVYSLSTPCTFPTHIGDRNIAQWKAVVEKEISSSAKYTSLMAEYKAIRKQYAEFLKTHGGDIEVPAIVPHLSQYYGKHVAVYDEDSTDNDNSDRYYISPFGFPRKWEGEDGGKWNGYGSAWINRPGSCKGGTMDVVNHISQDHLTELDRVADKVVGRNKTSMGMNEPCNVSGKFITATPSGNTAWVDILGFRHDFDGDAGSTCTGSKVETMQVTDTEFNAIQSSNDPYDAGYECGVSGMTGAVFTDFVTLQSNLIAKGAEALATIKDLTDMSGQVRDQTTEQQLELEQEVGDLASQQGQIAENQSNLINAKGRFETGEEQTTYTFRMYVVWLIVALLVMAVAIHAMVSGENTIFVYGVLGLCAFIVIYYAIVRGMRG